MFLADSSHLSDRRKGKGMSIVNPKSTRYNDCQLKEISYNVTLSYPGTLRRDQRGGTEFVL